MILHAWRGNYLGAEPELLGQSSVAGFSQKKECRFVQLPIRRLGELSTPTPVGCEPAIPPALRIIRRGKCEPSFLGVLFGHRFGSGFRYFHKREFEAADYFHE
jgi:hypothetical protein